MSRFKQLESDKKDALKAIEKVFANSTVPATATWLILREIRDELDVRIEALDMQISSDEKQAA